MSVSYRQWTETAATSGRHTLQAALLACTFGCAAGNLQVSPIVLEFSENQQANVLWLENDGDRPVHAQIRVLQWSQAAATDVLQPSAALRASPAIVQVPAGQRQLVRIIRPTPLSAVDANEQAYRVWVDELPEVDERRPPGLQFLLRYSIPVFVLPKDALPRDQVRKGPVDTSRLLASWQITADVLTLDVRNNGKQRVRLSELGWRTDNGAITKLHPGLLGYVLAGQHMQWRLPLAAELPHPGGLQARLNDAPTAQPLPTAGH
ncbi:molecular chaperone [Stenotrophomonas sp.]|uniref:fimbrial biogenesis chaperone n=1 Tax=Stenotrophomonas sp. TaxID=69392 RepID=UPI0028B2036E|nr:molecular chaperone [Stenotrophomonas sp.]